ncbi:Protein ATP6V1FNB like protein [Argiope bruennichi]|uniref:Protein ATP6V1FNB like protein n=1 Tax=Argiope bruennichi TaxID=94029 RepID=A0A8T0EDF7_ARGBR|nr:Protein ATP6V1FNB like protein [Argiope bruennichi]
MKNKTVCFVPLISVSFSDDWVSDDDSSVDETHSEAQEYDMKEQTSSMKAQYNPSPESTEEKKLFLKKETGKKRLCRSCASNKVKEPSTKAVGNDKIERKTLQKGKFNTNETTCICSTNGGSNEARRVDDMKPMKPVPISIKKHIYKGISHDGEGRSKYLQIRYRTAPEERWYNPVTSSMQYGWTWGYPPEIKCPEYGKNMTIIKSFFRPNDVNLKPRS